MKMTYWIQVGEFYLKLGYKLKGHKNIIILISRGEINEPFPVVKDVKAGTMKGTTIRVKSAGSNG